MQSRTAIRLSTDSLPGVIAITKSFFTPFSLNRSCFVEFDPVDGGGFEGGGDGGGGCDSVDGEGGGECVDEDGDGGGGIGNEADGWVWLGEGGDGGEDAF